ncbi:MAG: hypothetical protein K8T20_03620 [Planctomycetes bacterium]|nr:hypothetical protein [Planctomycetota bacterium]
MRAIPSGLPGEDLVTKGIEDLRCGLETLEAMLVSVGASRIRAAGVDVPKGIMDPEDRLYALIAQSHGDGAHSYYNSLIRRLVSFESALEHSSH